jgi:hypothetical protein
VFRITRALWLCAALVAPTALPAEERECEPGDFTSTSAPHLTLAEVRDGAGRRVHFFRGGGRCPDGPAAECRNKAYLVPGDTVVVAQHRGGFACAWYQRSTVNDAVVGWLPARALEELRPPADPPRSAWVREWSRFAGPGHEATLTIRLDPDGQSLRVVGEAQWTSAGASGPHLGEVDGTARPQGNRLVIQGGGDCVLELFLLGDGALFARDGHRCGGMNVTFDGLY